MNYAKVIGSALQLFPKKIKVTLIDAAKGNKIGKYKIAAELLPAAFNRPITLEIDNINWRVLQADPVQADDFLFTRKLTLQVQHAGNIDAKQLKYSVPTICSELPVTGTTSLYNDFTLEIDEIDWLQIEFVSLKQSGSIEEAVKIIEDILTGQPNPLLGYEQQYIRPPAAQAGLAIPIEKFCKRFSNHVIGNILLKNYGIVHNGFSLRSDSHTYYGILKNGFIQSLCLKQFDWTDDELMRVLSKHELCLVDWRNASRLSAETGEIPRSEYIEL